MNKDKGLAYICLLIVFFCWGSVYVANQYVLQVLTPVEQACFRFVIGAAALAAALLGRRLSRPSERMFDKILPTDWKYLFLVGFLGYYLTMECVVLSTEYAGASLASLINSLNPVLITIFAALFLKEELTLKKMICLAVSMVGVFIVSGGPGSGGRLIGVLFGVIALLTWAWTTVYNRRFTQRIPPLTVTFIGIVIGLVFHIPTAAVSLARYGVPVLASSQAAALPGARIITGKILLCVLYSGIIGTALPQFLWNFCLSKLSASVCCTFYPLMPVFSAILGVTLLGEHLGRSFFLGGALIVTSVIVSSLGSRSR